MLRMARHVPDPIAPLLGLRLTIEIDDILHVGRSAYQHVLIAETKAYGRALFLDEVLNSAEVDEGLYHSALVHPGMFLHPRPESVLIGGGAEGATLREVLKHADVQGALMVDIDEQAVKACRKHLPSWHQGSFDDSRASVVFEDVRKVLGGGEENSLDVIVLDLGDPASCDESQVGFTQEFFKLVRSRLRPNGVLAMQAGEFSDKPGDNFHVIYNTVLSVLPHAIPYRVGIGSFLANWGFIVASANPLNLAESGLPIGFKHRLQENGPENFEWFDEEAYVGMTWLPPLTRKRLAQYDPGLVNRDDQPTLQTVAAQ